MKIYTRTGDDGTTGLFGGQRVGKDSPRVEAYGAVDETNALIGVVRSALDENDALQERLIQVQNDLFVVGADLATPIIEGKKATYYVPRVDESYSERLEGWIDEAEAELPPMRTFILPSGTPAATQLHLARTVCRRAERRVITLNRLEDISPASRVYLNRLSDLLFVWSRLVNARAKAIETPWIAPTKEE